MTITLDLNLLPFLNDVAWIVAIICPVRMALLLLVHDKNWEVYGEKARSFGRGFRASLLWFVIAITWLAHYWKAAN